MANWSTAICEANGIKIYYTRTGGNKPPLILLHGLAANGACWTALAHDLEAEYDVIMPDARGHGKSSAPDHGYQYENLANDVVGFMKVMKLSFPVLLGHSMGGMTAAVVASRKPNLLRGLILDDPTFLSPEFQCQVFESDAADRHRKALNKSVHELVAESAKRHPDRSQETLELIAQARLETNANAFDILTPPNPDYMQLAKTFAVPSLLVTSDAGIVSSASAAELQLLNPKIHVEHIKGAGHGIQYDQPDRFAAAVRSFLHSILP